MSRRVTMRLVALLSIVHRLSSKILWISSLFIDLVLVVLETYIRINKSTIYLYF